MIEFELIQIDYFYHTEYDIAYENYYNDGYIYFERGKSYENN